MGWRRGCQFSLLPYQDAVRVSVACAHSLDVPLQIPLVCAMPLEDATLNVDHPPQIDATLKPRDHLFFLLCTPTHIAR